MIIRRVHKSHYTIIDNIPLRDASLSFRATGLLCYLLSLPDDWKISGRQLATVKKDRKDSVLAALKELEKAGYIKRSKMNDGKGHIVNLCQVSEIPHNFIEECAVSPCTALPDTVSPDTVKPVTKEVLSLRSTENEVTKVKKKDATSFSHGENGKIKPHTLNGFNLLDWHNPAFTWAREIADRVITKITAMPSRSAIERLMRVCLISLDSVKLAPSEDDISKAMDWWIDKTPDSKRNIAYIEKAWNNPANTEAHPVGKWFLEVRSVKSDEVEIENSRIENKNIAHLISKEMTHHGVAPIFKTLPTEKTDVFEKGQRREARKILSHDTIMSRIPDMVDKTIPSTKELYSWKRHA